jgi:hypothetical protein
LVFISFKKGGKIGHSWEGQAQSSQGTPLLRGRLSTVDLLIKISFFVKNNNIVPVLKMADLN